MMFMAEKQTGANCATSLADSLPNVLLKPACVCKDNTLLN